MKEKTQHTPGPWVAVKGDDNTSTCFDISVCAGPNDDRVRVATCHYKSYGGTKADPEANAHLISAAPDLLAALDRVYLEILQFLNEENFNRTVIWDAGYIVEALAKARGEQ